MKLIWHQDGISISEITSNRWVNSQLFTDGMGWLEIAGIKDYRAFHWEATVTPLGWYITIFAASGRIGEVQGSTFNLPLEVAAAVRRLL